MKAKILILLLIIGSMPAFAQVQERFKNSSKDTVKTDEQAEKTKEDGGIPKSPGMTTVDKDENFFDKLVIGGNATLNFGTYTFIYVAPSIGYRFHEKWVAGPGFIYQYQRVGLAYDPNTQQYFNLNDPIENTIYGPKFFVNYFPNDLLYGGVQFEYLNHDVIVGSSGRDLIVENRWTPVLFLEAGISTPVGSKGFMQLGLRYNLLHDYDSPYSWVLFPVIGIFF